MRIVLGVGAGIAAYKVCELLRLLTESGHAVRVVPTPDSLHFVGSATWEALSGQPVSTSPWDDVHEVAHVALGQQADLIVVAPATADLLARASAGLLPTCSAMCCWPPGARSCTRRPCTPRCGSIRRPRPMSRRCAPGEPSSWSPRPAG